MTKTLPRWIVFLFLLALPFAISTQGAAPAQPAQSAAPADTLQQPAPPPANGMAAPDSRNQSSEKIVTAYTLPPKLYRKARDLARFHIRFAYINFFYGIFILWVILYWRFGPKFRDWAESFSKNHFLQAWIFAPLLLLTMAVLSLPSDIYANSVELKYGLSVQTWGSWFWDWTKGQLLAIFLGIFLISLLYRIIRSSPRRWWFYFWLVSLPIAVLLVFLQPVIIDPMFHKFEPLQQKDPALTASLEKMFQHAGVDIPPERMFWMGAGEKTTELNAYVTGLGASKRIVVWDTTIAKMNTPQIVFVAGHETGHYALQHVWKGLAFVAVFLFVLFYLGFRTIGWFLQRWGKEWGIRGVADWASLPALLLLLSVYSFIAGPINNSFSRYVEHQADVFGLEVTHEITPDSAQIAAQSFQILGEVDLSDPAPNPVNVFMFYSHPAIPDRIRFALTYDPWAKGEQPEFVK